jgi:CheY-like chemotaxis protein
MAEDWRFKGSPHVEQGGLRAYAGVPLHFETEFGEHVAFGSLCVASNSPQPALSSAQQRSLARLADWIVSDIVHSARARRQRERRQILELISNLHKLCDTGSNMEEVVVQTLQNFYPNATVGLHEMVDGHILLEGGTDLQISQLQHGLWEDSDHFDHMINDYNHQEMVASKVIRVVATQCASQRTPTFLLVGSKNFRHVFDDVDSGFIHTCATILCRYWQGRALQEALVAKDNFLRGITHQLRTPIHGILGSVELLTEELKSRNLLPDTAGTSPGATPDFDRIDPYAYIRTIRSSARELISTVNSLIKLNQWADIAQTERDVSLHRIEEIESSLLNETLLKLSEDVLTRPSIIVRHHFPSHCDSLFIDMRLLLDCLQPLVVNAAQNTADGVVAVTFSMDDDLRSLIVDVEDNGRGIAPQDHERIFAAYEKVDAHTIEAGLGLTLACKSASVIDGSISLVRSEVGRGSHFRVVFQEPVCASSLPLRKQVKDEFVQLPPTFHRLGDDPGDLSQASLASSPLNVRTSILGHYFEQYLHRCGFAKSPDIGGSLVLIDFTTDLGQLHKNVHRVSAEQVGICLVPECALGPITFGVERFEIQNNIIYVQGPFLPETLRESLKRAESLLTQLSVTISDSSLLANGIAPTAEADGEATPKINGSATPMQEPNTLVSSPLDSNLAQSLQALRIDTQGPRPLPPSSRSQKPMALLVDDNSVNLRLLEMYCSRRSIPYRTAKDGAEAVRIFTEHRKRIDDPLLRQTFVTQPFNLVLMDLQMPRCDGVEATRQIRGLEKEKGWERSRMCIVTGQDSLADRRDAESAGSDEYLVKPVGPKVLDRWIGKWFPDDEG